MGIIEQSDERRSPGLIALCIASFMGCALLAHWRDSPYADLSGKYTDHLHHVYGVWLFWKHGMAVFTTPLGQLSAEGFAHSLQAWGEVPWMYPPGALVLFAPMTLIAQLTSLTTPQVIKATMLYVLFWSHVGFYLFARACEACPPGQRLLLRSFGWLMLTHLAVEGFYDPLWIGTGAAIVACARRGAHGRAMWWFALSATLHFRAVAFAPAAAYALFRLLRARPLRTWPFGALSFTALSCLGTVACFVLMYPSSQAHRDKYPPMSEIEYWPLFWIVVALTLLAIAHLAWRRAWVGAATIASVALIAITDFRGYLFFWHHAPTVLAAPIAAGLGVSEPTAQVTRASALLYGLALAKLVWLDSPMDLLTTLVDAWNLLQPMLLKKLDL
jgi:hypothetical protein